jgi:signal recognition particle subunit SEC65
VLFVPRKKELTKDERVKKEINRLRKIYKELPKDTLTVVEGLIVEAADLRVRLEDIRKDLDENGYDEMFSQSEKQEPYERERPQSRRYIAMNKSYQSIMKQLGDYIPKPDKNNNDSDDGFDAFVGGRDD